MKLCGIVFVVIVLVVCAVSAEFGDIGHGRSMERGMNIIWQVLLRDEMISV